MKCDQCGKQQDDPTRNNTCACGGFGPSDATCSAILERIRVNDQFLDIVNGLCCDDPALFEGLRRKALPLHADVNRILRKMLRDSQQNKQLGESGFVFLDDSRWPYMLRKKDDGEWWLYYWQNRTKSWTTVRPADEDWVESLRDRALPPDQAALYLPPNAEAIHGEKGSTKP